MNDVFFGLSEQYDSGNRPSVALNASGTVLEVHKNEAGTTLYYRIGTLDAATVAWRSAAATQYDSGRDNRCALNDAGTVVEVHKNEAGSSLYIRVGAVNGSRIDWKTSKADHYSDGYEPAVALNGPGTVVEIHRSDNIFNDKLYYRVGRVAGSGIDWAGKSKDSKVEGKYPQIALNDGGRVVEVHEDGGRVHYRVGSVDGDTISFGSPQSFGTGGRPSVALTHDGTVVAVWQQDGNLYQRTGRAQNSTIQWAHEGGIEFDDGQKASVATAGGMAIQVHESETILYGLWSSTSILTERASWMQDRLGALGDTRLADLVLPGSHDAGMYVKGLASLAKTQDLSIYGQLQYGIRWFDLRPKWTGSTFVLYHGPIDGPDLSVVLADARRFAQEGHRELILFKLSHFKNIDAATYSTLAQQVKDALGPWLVTSRPDGSRLADIPLRDYVADGPAFLVVVDGDFAVDDPQEGLWVYRDWESETPAEGDLCVYDIYSNKLLLSQMAPNQIGKFESFTGVCKNDPSVPCDLFLLSWTLTPPTDVWDVSKPANRSLGTAMAELPVPNAYGQIVNILYVDYVEYARVTDVALFQNGCPHA